MKKIGIITLYYKNYNYGGLLQSYALCEILNAMGFDAKQISFRRTGLNTPKKGVVRRFMELVEEISFLGALKKSLYKIKVKVDDVLCPSEIRDVYFKGILKRNELFSNFANTIPHTRIVDETNITELNCKFDSFVTGSDQVWKPGVCCDEYFLKFVKSDKNKISYAASIGRSNLVKEDENYIVNAAKYLNAVSLREFEAVELFATNSIESTLVLDPTLLLTREEWDNFSQQYLIDGEYIFCYFLGISLAQREAVQKFAKSKNLKIVTFPALNEHMNKADIQFGDIKIWDASPKNFVDIIKNSTYVITDSFHTAVFSGIYNKDFYVFEREEEKTMNGRVINLLKLYGTPERFIKSETELGKADSFIDIFANENFLKMREKSIQFLINNL